MSKPKDLSVNESKFVTNLLSKSLRIDGRKLDEFRQVELAFGSNLGHVELSLGNTKLVARISAEVVKPYEDRPLEGVFMITTDISSMASGRFENNRQSGEEVMVSRLIEKAVRRSNALDLESLCIVAGKSCWMIRADVHYLDYDGGLVDATCIGVIAGLLHFKRPDTSVEGDKTIVHSAEERPLVPLSVLHVPVCVSFSFYESENGEPEGNGGTGNEADAEDQEDEDSTMDSSTASHSSDIVLVDATEKEEALRSGEMTVTINKTRDICQISKAGGLQIEAYTILSCMNVALNISIQLTDLIYQKLKQDDKIRNAGNIALTAENER